MSPVPGYPETKTEKRDLSWRAQNDEVFNDAAAAYNNKYHFSPKDDEYITPEFLKAWAMVESGGEGDKDAFLSDPLQVNNPGDWPSDNRKSLIGLRKGQPMAPRTSAAAALEWLRYKGYEHDAKGNRVHWRGKEEALRRYNGSKRRDDYARKVMDLWRSMQPKE